MLTLCGAHHRAVHRGDLIVGGDSAATVRFRHADGRCYGDVLQPHALDVVAKVFAALRQLGFRDAEIRALLAERAGKESHAPTASSLLREALSRLGPSQPARPLNRCGRGLVSPTLALRLPPPIFQ